MFSPHLPENERVGRRLKNAFGIEETVILPTKHWRYFDWLAEIGNDMDEWVKKADLARHQHEGMNFSLSGQIEAWLVLSERQRYLDGEPIPMFINSHYYE